MKTKEEQFMLYHNKNGAYNFKDKTDMSLIMRAIAT